MPSQLPRAQVILQPEVHSAIKHLAQLDRRTISSMSAELLTAAIQLPKYKGMLKAADEIQRNETSPKICRNDS